MSVSTFRGNYQDQSRSRPDRAHSRRRPAATTMAAITTRHRGGGPQTPIPTLSTGSGTRSVIPAGIAIEYYPNRSSIKKRRKVKKKKKKRSARRETRVTRRLHSGAGRHPRRRSAQLRPSRSVSRPCRAERYPRRLDHPQHRAEPGAASNGARPGVGASVMAKEAPGPMFAAVREWHWSNSMHATLGQVAIPTRHD